MSSSAINTQVAQLKIGNVQNQADNSAVYSGGIWSLKNSTALPSVTITDAGDVGVGVTPSAWSALKSIQLGNSGAFVAGGATFKDVYFGSNGYYDGTNWRYTTSSDAGLYSIAGSIHAWYGIAPGIAGNSFTFTERMRIDASGNVRINTTAPVYASDKLSVENTNNNADVALGLKAHNRVLGLIIRNGSGTYLEFYCQATNTTTGSITTNGTNTSYGTGPSDYRLKEQVQDLSGGLNKIKALRPVSFVWKDSKKEETGFIAHEIQTVIPECVNGQKDEIDAEGNPVYQSIFPAPAQMIANLVAAIQELSAKNDALEARLAALEAKP